MCERDSQWQAAVSAQQLSLVLCGNPEEWHGAEGGGGAQEGPHICVLVADARCVWQKPTQGCETIILLKKKSPVLIWVKKNKPPKIPKKQTLTTPSPNVSFSY